MFLKRKRPEDKVESDRQLIIAYKKVFQSEEGRLVFSDLANRFHLLNKITGSAEEKAEKNGECNVIKHILTQREVDLAQFEKILRGEL